jgi:TolB protein
MRRLIVILLLMTASQAALAELRVEIISGSEGALPIAVIPFSWDSATPGPITTTASLVSADLYRSGQFLPLDEAEMAQKPVAEEDIRFGTWRILKTDYIVIGRVQDTPEGGYDLIYQLFDVNTSERLLSRILTVGPGDLRYGAHRIADDIYERLTGIPGAFATRIAYITATGLGDEQLYELVVSDADGYGPQSIVGSPEPLLSPNWSPDGRKLAYVSFEKGNSAIYVQDVTTGSRQLLSSHKGINGAPAFSPDGRKMAMALSHSGNLEIYVLDLATGQYTQLTRHWAIDTEPAWSPDGQEIFFTSDRAGQPQIYSVPATGGNVKRITFEGENNARVSISPDGRNLAMAHGDGNRYRIAVLEQKSNRLVVLSRGQLDESPSFAPNGSMILYASKDGEQGVLAAVSVDGNVRQRLVLSGGDVREPAWSPVIR